MCIDEPTLAVLFPLHLWAGLQKHPRNIFQNT